MGDRNSRAAPRFSILGDSRGGVFGHVFMFGVFRQSQRLRSDTTGRSPGVVCADFHEKACRSEYIKGFTLLLIQVRAALPDGSGFHTHSGWRRQWPHGAGRSPVNRKAAGPCLLVIALIAHAAGTSQWPKDVT
jgi:hypothetical protein